MYDAYRTLPSDQAALSPRHGARQHALLHALVQSPRTSHESTQNESTRSLQELLDRSAEWEARRSAHVEAAREAKQEALESELPFQPRILRRTAHGGEGSRRSAEAYYTAQRKWQQHVEDKIETLRRQEAEEAAMALQRGLGEKQRLLAVNKARVPARARVSSPTEPVPQANPPKPSPRSTSRKVKSAAPFQLATADRARHRRVQPVEPDTTAPVTVTARRRSAAPTQSSRRTGTLPKAPSPPRRTKAATTQSKEASDAHQPVRLSQQEEAQLVARLVSPSDCHHHHALHTTTTTQPSPRHASDGELFLARQALWAHRTQLKKEALREELLAKRADVWQKTFTFAPVLSPRSRELAARYAARLEGAASSSANTSAREVEERNVRGASDEASGRDSALPVQAEVSPQPNTLVVPSLEMPTHGQQWTRQDAERAAAKVEFCDARLNRVRQQRMMTRPIERVLRYTDSEQLRLVTSSPSSLHRSSRASPGSRERGSATGVASALSHDGVPPRERSPTTALQRLLHSEDDNALSTDRESSRSHSTDDKAATHNSVGDAAEEKERARASVEPWPTPPRLSRVPLSLAREEEEEESVMDSARSHPRHFRDRRHAAPSGAASLLLDESATRWVHTAPARGSTPLSPRWAASACWLESMADASVHGPDASDVQAQEGAEAEGDRESQKARHPGSPHAWHAQGTDDHRDAALVSQSSPRRGELAPPQTRADPGPGRDEETHMLSGWWRRLCAAQMNTASLPPRGTRLDGLPLETALQAMQGLLAAVGPHTNLAVAPRLGFEPILFDVPWDTQQHLARRFSVYMVVSAADGTCALRTTYHEPLAGTINEVSFRGVYRWLLEAGTRINGGEMVL